MASGPGTLLLGLVLRTSERVSPSKLSPKHDRHATISTSLESRLCGSGFLSSGNDLRSHQGATIPSGLTMILSEALWTSDKFSTTCWIMTRTPVVHAASGDRAGKDRVACFAMSIIPARHWSPRRIMASAEHIPWRPALHQCRTTQAARDLLRTHLWHVCCVY